MADDHATLMLVWHGDGQTRVIDMVNDDGELTYLVKLFVDALPDEVKDGAETAILRGTIADMQNVIVSQRVKLREARDRIAELETEREFLNGLVYTVPVQEASV